jgi:7-cyano-7-deazaguanine synthase in queuosine biosynthesis
VSRSQFFLCSGAAALPRGVRNSGTKVVRLDALGHRANVNLRVEDVAKVFLRHLSPRLADLLEIASYVFTADAATRRGEKWIDGATEDWRRDLNFVIPVRDMSFWAREEVSTILRDSLQFLSDDRYAFYFEQLETERPLQGYLELSREEDWPFHGVERVLMFSGGLDSLAGAVETASSGQNLVLVSHRPVSTLDARQKRLVAQLRKLFDKTQILHVPVWVNKEVKLGREFSQRTRSFLFAALGTAVAQSLQAKGVRFFENGIVSLNLPVADEVVGARASRTTHPEVLKYFSELYTLVLERPFVVDNPYFLITKADVVKRVAEHGAAQLIAYTCSCFHTMHKSKTRWHCGTCSQCIDRRVAVLAAEQSSADPASDYEVDVFLGSRSNGQERNMAVDYVRHVTELLSVSDQQFAARFNRELSLAVRSADRRGEVASALVNLHKKYAAESWSVIKRQLEDNLDRLADRSLPASSMLALVFGQEHQPSVWERFARRVGDLLAEGIPIAYRSQAPANESRLQEQAAALLHGQELELEREFPFLRWSASHIKPDFSSEPLALWVEMKYLRRSTDVRRATEEIAADITKYGDSGRRTLFVVYDPGRQIVDDRQFAADIERHVGMFVRIVR